MHRIAAIYLILTLGCSLPARAESTCEPGRRVVSLSANLATASIWSNIWGTKDSIRYVTEKKLRDGQNAINTTDFCPEGCASKSKPILLMEASPLKLHPRHKHPDCAEKLSATEKQPLVFEKTFRSFDEIHEWFNAFSRGKGDEGELLYDLCDGGCSPRYRSYVRESPNQEFHLRTEAVCGLPRDKEDNRYHIALAAVVECR